MNLFKNQSTARFWSVLGLFAALLLPWILGYYYIQNIRLNNKAKEVTLIREPSQKKQGPDHSQYSLLQQEFETPEQVTEACLYCHNTTAQEVMQTSHWTWSREYVTENGDTIQLGKKNILNNFCIGIQSNEPRCTSCHIGYGWKDDGFDFSEERKIDCLVCHDQTDTYKKFPSGAGYPVTEKKTSAGEEFMPPDYRHIAQNIGSPRIENCGACHFVGGGGNNVKHGDIATELKEVTREVDVHMASDGAGMSCVDCHRTEEHAISGSLYSIASQDTNRIGCSGCHSANPHANEILNLHSARVDCQTCHIPEYAKVSATKMSWDWSTAGKLNPDGSMVVKKDSMGNIIYHSMKGDFTWAKNVEPEYRWFNGIADHYVLGDPVNPNETLNMNPLQGSYADKRSKIIPVKVHRANIIYDVQNEYLINPHLFGKDSTAFWTHFDWHKAAKAGAEATGLAYSGEYGFIASEMTWPINHMVAPREQSLTCIECHDSNGRLSELNDFYLIGRDRHAMLDRIGIGIILLSLIGVTIHSIIRILSKSNRSQTK